MKMKSREQNAVTAANNSRKREIEREKAGTSVRPLHTYIHSSKRNKTVSEKERDGKAVTFCSKMTFPHCVRFLQLPGGQSLSGHVCQCDRPAVCLAVVDFCIHLCQALYRK